MISALDHLFDKLIEIFTPLAPPDDMEYCPACGGTMFDKYWQVCPHCYGSGYVPKRQH